MTPKDLLEANELYKQYTRITHILEDLQSCKNYRLQLMMQFPLNKDAKWSHSPDLPIPQHELEKILNSMLNDLDSKLLALGVTV